MTDPLEMNSIFWNVSEGQSSSLLSFLEQSLKPLVVYDAQGKTIYASQSLLELLQTELQSIHFFDYFSGNSMPVNVLRAYWNRALQGERLQFLTTIKGDLGEIECSLEFEPDVNLMFVLVTKIAAEQPVQALISAHERAIAALIKTEERWKTFVSNSPYLFIQTSSTGQIVYTNAIARQILGYREEELMGRHITELVHPKQFSDFELIFQRWSSTFQTQPLGIECWWRAKSGQWLALYAKGQHFPTALDLDGVAISGYNITERKRLEYKLRTSEERFQSLLMTIPGAVFYCDLFYTMKFASDGMEAITGYNPSVFINNHLRSYLSIIHQDDIPLIRDSLTQSVSGHAHSMEYRIIHADGQIRWVSERKQGVFDRNGNLLWLCGILMDISNLKHSEVEHKLTAEKLRLSEAINRKIIKIRSDLMQLR
ncbi:MAG: PAS domain-containing protein [Oscillatoriales cyanobacterium C42_A2020_001]|nr:PAS domain-containing protein [Leptolyngbyaceae cyanobacterium C42_A2020_001]